MDGGRQWLHHLSSAHQCRSLQYPLSGKSNPPRLRTPFREACMFRIPLGSTRRYCDGRSRRSFLQIGLAGMGAIGLPGMLRLKEASATAVGGKKDTAVILLWLDGGPG